MAPNDTTARVRVRCATCDHKIEPGATYFLMDGKPYHRTCMNEERIARIEDAVFGRRRTFTVAVAPALVRPMGVAADR